MQPRPVLFVTSRFPPVASVGAVRIRKFCRYLPANGWQPVVITGPIESIDESGGEAVGTARDYRSLDDIPASVEVVRLSAALQRWPREAAERWSRRLGCLTGWAGLDSERWMAGLGWRAERRWRARTFPDFGIWQLRTAVAAAEELHTTHRFEAIFSSAMPFSDHLIAMEIQRRLQLPWIADFRDPWVGYVHGDAASQPNDRRAIRAEARIVNSATRVVSIGKLMTARFRERYPQLPAWKFATIRNGFDPADLPTPTAIAASPTLRLLYAGSFYGGRGPEMLLDVIRSMRRSGADIRLELAGRAGSHADAIRAATEAGVAAWHGLLPHRDAMRLMGACDVLVVLQDDRPGTEIDLSAKTYEYLGSGKPILALVGRDGEADRLLKKFDGVWRCQPFDKLAIRDALSDILQRRHRAELHTTRDTEDLAPLTRPFQTRQLAELLDEVTQPHRRGTRLFRISRRILDARNVENVTILAYHRISDESSPLTDGRGLTHSVANFERQMAYLAERFEPVRLSRVLDALAVGRPMRRAVVVTFDDGYSETLRIAAPILRRMGIPATVCISTAVVDNVDMLWRDKLNWLMVSGHAVVTCEAIKSAYRTRGIEPQPGESVMALTRRHFLADVIPELLDDLLVRSGTSGAEIARGLGAYVSARALRSADREWIEIANHTHTHPVMAHLDEAPQRRELLVASDLLTALSGYRPEAVAIPFGMRAAYSPQMIDLVRETGHRSALDLRRRPNRAGVSPFELSRIPAPQGDGSALALAIERREGPAQHRDWKLIHA